MAILKLNTKNEEEKEEVVSEVDDKEKEEQKKEDEKNKAAETHQDIKEYFFKQTRSIEECLIWCTEHGCSDLYVKVGERPYISRYGKIYQLPCTPITKDMWAKFYELNVLNELNAKYVRNKLLDISTEVRIPDDSSNFGKYKTNYYRYRSSFGFSEDRNVCTFRMIRPSKPMFSTINFPKDCEEMLHEVFKRRSGILYFTGPTGSGKSTSMAACINTYSQPGDVLDNKVIITLEDPIENSFDCTDTFKVMQKELDRDFKSFDMGIKAALREHPTHVIVGECRDKEVITAAIEANRTGHSVITSFHAADVPGTISRLLFHLDNDKNLSYDLIISLNCIVSQHLVPSDTGYVVDVQYMLFNDTITKKLIAITEQDCNIAVEVEKLFHDEELISQGLVRNWAYDYN